MPEADAVTYANVLGTVDETRKRIDEPHDEPPREDNLTYRHFVRGKKWTRDYILIIPHYPTKYNLVSRQPRRCPNYRCVVKCHADLELTTEQ